MIYYVRIDRSMWMPYEWLFCVCCNLCSRHNIISSYTRSSILSMQNVCDVYARNMDMDILNSAKTNCIFSPAHPNSLPGLPLHFMNTDIVFVPSCTFLGVSVSSHDISDKNFTQSVQHFYRRSNEVMSYFKSLSRDVKSQLFSTFLFRCIWCTVLAFLITLLNFKLYYTAWRKVIRTSWCLPFTTHRFIHTINNSLPIDN